MGEFIQNLIHMTQGELFTKYLLVWLLIGIFAVMSILKRYFKRGK